MKKHNQQKYPLRWCKSGGTAFKTTGFCILLVVCQGILICSSRAFAQEQTIFVSNGREVNIQDFNQKIDSFATALNIPAVSLAIIENNQVVYSYTSGFKDATQKEAVDVHTAFEACSLSKMFLVYVVYQLVEKGELDLDKPMYQYLENPRLEHDPRYRAITPRMILNHTSGLENWQKQNNPDVLELKSAPSMEFTYSGEGFHYLADVISNILGESYEEYVTRFIIKPMGLEDTKLLFTERDSTTNYTSGHDVVGNKEQKWTTVEPWPASSVHTQAKDYALLLTKLFGNPFLSKASAAGMLKAAKVIEENDSAKYLIGNAFFMLITPQDTLMNFSGSNTGFKADFLYSLKGKRGFVFFANSDMGILLGPYINQLTTGLNGNLYFNGYQKEYFAELMFIGRFLQIYNEEGKEEVLKAISQLKEREVNLRALETLMYRLYLKDKELSGDLASKLLEYDPNSSFALVILGALNLQVKKDYKVAKSYFVKAQKLYFEEFDLNYFINLCDEKMAKK